MRRQNCIPSGGAFVYDAAWLSLNPQKLSLSVFVRRYMRSRAQIFSGSAYVISASTWSSVTTTPSMTRWSTLGMRNCFHAVLRQSTASCSRTTVRWQRAVKLNVSEKAFRFSADAQGRCPASGLADAVRQPTASSAWRSSRLVFLLLNASATCGLFFFVAFAMCSSNLRGLLARTGCDSPCWTSFCPAPPSTRYPPDWPSRPMA
jgi:hypothetical protein